MIKVHWLTLQLQDKELLISTLREELRILGVEKEWAWVQYRVYKKMSLTYKAKVSEQNRQAIGFDNEIAHLRERIQYLEAQISQQEIQPESQMNQQIFNYNVFNLYN
ncbi:hypothetical protein FGO68_gene11693 [Halteria grandinella]|uniref:Uncharacterized protein n=1 Tax=Halteria grandinella TaxID=5974 RepID=A0A8J8NM14_HALGN|nr:hypothetical protein FGO68_gene11693 [Halteria grandinella]